MTNITELPDGHYFVFGSNEAWRKRKHELAQLVANTESDPRVVEALKKALFS